MGRFCLNIKQAVLHCTHAETQELCTLPPNNAISDDRAGTSVPHEREARCPATQIAWLLFPPPGLAAAISLLSLKRPAARL
jgi:hypothetical protein